MKLNSDFSWRHTVFREGFFLEHLHSYLRYY